MARNNTKWHPKDEKLSLPVYFEEILPVQLNLLLYFKSNEIYLLPQVNLYNLNSPNPEKQQREFCVYH